MKIASYPRGLSRLVVTAFLFPCPTPLSPRSLIESSFTEKGARVCGMVWCVLVGLVMLKRVHSKIWKLKIANQTIKLFIVEKNNNNKNKNEKKKIQKKPKRNKKNPTQNK